MSVSERFISEVELMIMHRDVRSFRDFCAIIDINPQTITQIKAGKQGVTTDIISKTLERFPSFDIGRVFGVGKPLEVSEVTSSDPIQSWDSNPGPLRP